MSIAKDNSVSIILLGRAGLGWAGSHPRTHPSILPVSDHSCSIEKEDKRKNGTTYIVHNWYEVPLGSWPSSDDTLLPSLKLTVGSIRRLMGTSWSATSYPFLSVLPLFST